MILTIDIGGTVAKMGLLEVNGTIRARREVSVSFDGYRTPILTTVTGAAGQFLQDEKAVIEGIGVSATGQIDTSLGRVIGTNGRIPGYEGARIREMLEAQFSVPVRVLNDANAAALGEWFLGAGRGVQDMLMVTLGTGVGGGLILGGKLYEGSRGLAGELGHFTLYKDGVQCTCGRCGCFECYASVNALLRRAKADNGQQFLEQVRAGDSRARAVLYAWLDDVAAGVTGLIHIFNPALVVIGGGVSRQQELLMQPLTEKILAGVMPRFAENLRVERAALGNDAGMIGALAFWLNRERCGLKEDKS